MKEELNLNATLAGDIVVFLKYIISTSDDEIATDMANKILNSVSLIMEINN